MVRGICRVRLGDVEGDDAAQRVLLRLWQGLEAGREFASLPAYAATCARYSVLDSYRDAARRATPAGDLSEQLWADAAPGPAEHTERAEEVTRATARVEALLAQLSPREAEVMRATALADRSTAQAAQVLGITATGVRSTQVRAMARLRELCGTQSTNPLALPSQRRTPTRADTDTVSFKRVTGADREFARYRDRVGLDAAMAGLPPETRRVVELRFTQNLPVAVVARQLDRSKQTVCHHTRVGLAALRTQLGDPHPADESPARDAARVDPPALPAQRRTGADTDREFQQYRDRVGFDKAVARLPQQTRRVVELRFTQNLPVTVVAHQLHRGTTHVRALTEAGLAVLRAQLGEHDPAGELPERREQEDTPQRGRSAYEVWGSAPEDTAAVTEVAAMREPRARDIPGVGADLSTSAEDVSAAGIGSLSDPVAEALTLDEVSEHPGQPSTAALVARAHTAVASLPAPRAAPGEGPVKRVTAADREFARYRGRVGLDAAMAGLPPQTRRVVEMRFTQNVPVAVVAGQLGRSKQTVCHHTRVGLAALRAQLGDGQPDSELPERREEDTSQRGRATTAVRGSSPEDASAVPEVAAMSEHGARDVPDDGADLSTRAEDLSATEIKSTSDPEPDDLADDDEVSDRSGRPSTAALVAQAHAAVASLPAPRAAPDEDDRRRDQLARWHTDDHPDEHTEDRGAGREWVAMTRTGDTS